MPNFRQHDITDCGPACLSYVLYRHGLHLPIARIRQLAGTNQSGTTALGLVETANACGCEAKGLRCQFEDLSSLPTPSIAHIVTSKGLQHYVVITKVGKQRIKLMDPAMGRVEKWSIDEFKAVWTNVVIVLSPTQDFQPTDRTEKPWMRLVALLKPHRNVVAQALVGVILGTLLSLSTAIYIQKIVDNVIIDGNRNLLRLLGISMFVILAVRMVLGYLQSILILRCAQKIDAGLILGYYRHVMHLPQSFFDTMRVGEIIARVRDARAIRDFLTGTVLELIINPMILIFALAAMFVYSWQLAVFSLLLIPANLIVYLASDWLNRRYQREIMERNADFDAQVVESLHSISVVRSCGLESEMGFRTESRLVRLLRNVWIASKGGLLVGTAGGLITQSFSIGLLWIGANLVIGSQLTAGELMSCHALAGYITGPIVAIIGMNASIRAATTSTDRLYEILDLELESDEGKGSLFVGDTCELCFESVHFHYPGRTHTLKEVSFSCRNGQITALAGQSGCGKSTILSLIQRHYAPDQGRILLAGQNIAYCSLSSLRSMIAHVPQRIDLITGTILDNLAPGETRPDMPRIIELCKQIGIFEFIESLPRGFHTFINENGANLSGGQRQRIAVVRALYANVPVILLDEPSSALDSDSEQMLIRTLLQLKEKGSIILMAVHNQKLLELCDQKIQMKNGEVESIEIQDPESVKGQRDECEWNEAPALLSSEPILHQSASHSLNGDAYLCPEARNLKHALLTRSCGGALLGHIHANVSGIDENGTGWFLQPGKCDLLHSTGDWPAIFGFEIGPLSQGWAQNCAHVLPKIQEARSHGGIISVSWIAENLATGGSCVSGAGVQDILPGASRHALLIDALDQIASNLGNLTDADGHTIPILFRCWPQQNGDHFWWGRSRCTEQEFIRLYRFTVDYLRTEKGVRNFLFVFGAGNYSHEFSDLTQRFPGKNYVDVFGLEGLVENHESARIHLQSLLRDVVRFGIEYRIASAVTYFGCADGEGNAGLGYNTDDTWMQMTLAALLRHKVAGQLAYLCFASNPPQDPKGYHLPYQEGAHSRHLELFVQSGELITCAQLRDNSSIVQRGETLSIH